METLLRAEKIYKDYPAKAGKQFLNVLAGVDIDIPKGTVISIVGPSGCGKSTLLHILGGLDKPSSGSVYFGDKDLSTMNEKELAAFRNRNMGFVFQFHHLLPEFTALENVFMPGLIQDKPVDELKERARNLLDQFNIGDRAHHRPSELSGGEQQRVAVARALMNNPEIILADEPTGNLDEENTEIMLEMLFNVRIDSDLSIVLVTHDRSIADRSNMIFELRKGKLYRNT
ncbi:MAG TPA: ABC transporter ATP-binding protein [Balneolales bacterium]|nr:ABC transporter ATP-binding protein [Balneolales bacterium]